MKKRNRKVVCLWKMVTLEQMPETESQETVSPSMVAATLQLRQTGTGTMSPSVMRVPLTRTALVKGKFCDSTFPSWAFLHALCKERKLEAYWFLCLR